MDIKILIFLALLFALVIKGQDSAIVSRINKDYSRYYQTYIKSISPSGKYIVKQNRNSYGINDYMIIRTADNRSNVVPKGNAYTFVDDRYLIIETSKQLLFYDADNKTMNQVQGYFKLKILDSSIIAYSSVDGRLYCFKKDGQEIWRRNGVRQFEYDEENHKITYILESVLAITNVDGTEEHTAKLDGNVLWMQASVGQIWLFSVDGKVLTLLYLSMDLTVRHKNIIQLPQDYDISSSKEYFEVRENRYFIMALRKRANKPLIDKVKVSYSLQNTASDSFQLFIYDTVKSVWKWFPKSTDGNNISFFVSGKGDFIYYNLAEDAIEHRSNPLLNVLLVKNYGDKIIPLGKLHIDRNNFFYDEESNQLIYFRDRQ